MEFGNISKLLGKKYSDIKYFNLVKENIAQKFHKYEKYLDSNFEKEINSLNYNKFLEHYWELFLVSYFADKNIEILEHSNEGPDIKIKNGSKIINIDTVCPTPGEKDNRVLRLRDVEGKIEGGVEVKPIDHGHIDSKKILLRLTSVIEDKSIKFSWDICKRAVSKEDVCLIAINSQNVHELAYDMPGFPSVSRVLFGIGDLQINIVTNEQSYSPQPSMQKTSGVPVNSKIFLSDEYRHISGIIFADVSEGDLEKLRHPIALIHNPNAINKLPPKSIPVDEEYVADLEKSELRRLTG